MTDLKAPQQRASRRDRTAGAGEEAVAASGFRPTARRRNRLVAGLALGAIAIGGNVLVYSSLDSKSSVVQITRDVPAGELITADMLRPIDVGIDDSVSMISADEMASLVGQYARVRLGAGSLVVRPALQLEPLVSVGNAVVAVEVKSAELPNGLRERVPVRIVIPPANSAPDQTPRAIDGRIVGLPTPSESGVGTQSVSIEVAEADAPIVAAAPAVRIVLLVPSEDPAVGDEDGE